MTNINWQLFISFLKIGAISFGGGPSAIALMEKELTDNTTLTENDFSEALALGNSLPGPIITNIAVYAGLKLGGTVAAAVAVLGAVLPSVFIMGGGVFLLMNYQDLPLLKAALKALKPTAVALLAFTIYKLFPASFTTSTDVLIGVVALLFMIFLKVHPALAIALSGLAGMLIYR